MASWGVQSSQYRGPGHSGPGKLTLTGPTGGVKRNSWEFSST